MLQVSLGATAGLATGNLNGQSDVSCETPTQTAGPFYPTHTQSDVDADLTIISGRTERASGQIIYVSGQVLDDDLKAVPGALVDVWQANAHGRYHHDDDPNPAPVDPNFQGWAQIRTDDDGHCGFKTIIPGSYPVDEEWTRPPHIHFKVSKRGYHELTTQMYFSGNELNNTDQLLLEIPESERGKVVIDFTDGASNGDSGVQSGRFNIILPRVKK